MCRFIYYRGASLRLSSLITEPKNSLIHQSTHARERAEPLNGDGFGVSWYVPGQDEPGLFRSIQPAWSNQNLRSLARVVSSTCVLAHVRAASHGLAVIEPNCHPFVRDRYAFMHNGEIGAFPEIRRPLQESLSDQSFRELQGTTDSEHLFSVFMDELRKEEARTGCDALATALHRSVSRVLELVDRHGGGAPSRLNLLVSDGEAAVACRVAAGGAPRAESLYVSDGGRYRCEDGICRMTGDGGEGKRAVLVSSEPLSDDETWEPVPENHYVTIDGSLGIGIRSLAA